MTQKRLIVCILFGVVALSSAVVLLWPAEDRESTVQRHLLAMEEALQRYNTQPSASEHMEAFDAHQSQLLMLGYFQQELFFAPARLGTPEYRDLIQAVMKHAENRPICSWTPQPNGVSISVYATAKDMTKWRTLLGEHNGTTLSP